MVSETPSDEKKTWLYAFVILLLVSLSMLLMRLLNVSFLLLDFEAIVVYLPTIIAGAVAFYTRLKH